jgi:benzil reductase ((S)-benzoin forming)
MEEGLSSLRATKAETLLLINNAAVISPIDTLFSLELGAIQDQLAVNLLSPIALSYAFCRTLRGVAARKRIINISSRGAAIAGAGLGMYCVSKAGLEMLTRIIHLENVNEPYPTECVGVRPGGIDTAMPASVLRAAGAPDGTRTLFEELSKKGFLQDPAEVSARIVARVIDAPVESGRIYELPFGSGLPM